MSAKSETGRCGSSPFGSSGTSSCNARESCCGNLGLICGLALASKVGCLASGGSSSNSEATKSARRQSTELSRSESGTSDGGDGDVELHFDDD